MINETGMFYKRPSRESAVDFIVGQIEGAILERGLKPGDKLPTTRELQDILGASLGTLREALRILEQKGLLEARLGRKGGIFVKAVTSSKVSESLGLLIRQKQVSVEHLMIFRNTLEVSAAAWAAVNASAEDVADLRRLLVEMEVHLEKGMAGFDPFFEVEDRLHRALARMTRNPLFESVLTTVYDHHPGYNLEVVKPRLENMEQVFGDWKKLAASIADRRPEDAWTFMAAHFHNFVPTTTTAAAPSRSETGRVDPE